MNKTTKYHFGSTVIIESNQISMKNAKVKFDDKFFTVDDTYIEIDKNGTGIWHHICSIIQKN